MRRAEHVGPASRRSGVAAWPGETRVSGAGLGDRDRSLCGREPTDGEGVPRRSQGRAGAATWIVPAAVVRWIATESEGWGRSCGARELSRRGPYATALTGWIEVDPHRRGGRGPWASGRSSVATGCSRYRRSWRVWPSAQPSQPGRFTTTATLTVSPGVSGGSWASGGRSPRRAVWACHQARTPACSRGLPPNGCTLTRARATGSLVRLAPDHAIRPRPRSPATRPGEPAWPRAAAGHAVAEACGESDAVRA